MIRRWPRLSDERFSLVTPAKAGVQVLNGSRAVRVISKANCGWLRPCTLGSLSLRGQKKGTKEKAARSARKLLAFLAPPGARKLAGRIKRASGSLSARLQAPSGAAVLGARYGFERQQRWVSLRSTQLTKLENL